jgi:hypothetical protein
MEITKRFPQQLGNLAGEREIPTFPQPIMFVSNEKRRPKNERYEVNHVSHTKILTLPLWAGDPHRDRDSNGGHYSTSLAGS